MPTGEFHKNHDKELDLHMEVTFEKGRYKLSIGGRRSQDFCSWKEHDEFGTFYPFRFIS